MVMGEDSCSKDHEFEYRCHILYGHLFFFTLICCKSCIVCLKRPKINKKEARVGLFIKKNKVQVNCTSLWDIVMTHHFRKFAGNLV